MEYLMLITDVDADGDAWQPDAADFEAWVVDAHEAGVRIRGNRLRPPTEATIARRRGGEVLLSDAPLSEAKEWIAGYDLLEASTLEEAVEVASRHPRARTGHVVLYPTHALEFANPVR
jgi:hypothetical protein